MTDVRIAELLDELTPRYDDRRGEWERVSADARAAGQRRLPSPLRARVAIVAGVVAAVATLVLAWPFGSQHPSLLNRALAAVGEGPVLHVVLRGEWGGTLIDLNTGDRTAIYGDTEIWFDSSDGREHTTSRLGGVVQDEEVGKPAKAAPELALAREYRHALEAGTAQIAGEDTIDGEAVVWITIHRELLPDVADGKDHEWAQQVAVSKETYKPVALRETRDGKEGPGTLQRVLDLQLLPSGQGDFTAARPSLNGSAFKQGREPIALEQAGSVLGTTPLWLGHDYNGLPLAQVYRETTSAGHERRVRLTGAKAEAAIKCSQIRGSGGGECFRSLGLGSVEVTADGVFMIQGPMTWSDEESSVVFFYGSVGDDSNRPQPDPVPQFDRPNVTVTESTEVSPFRRGVGTYAPPPGSLFLAAGARTGYLERDGLQIGIDAAGEDAILAAAHALAPMQK
jgi:hypothetical protein